MSIIDPTGNEGESADDVQFKKSRMNQIKDYLDACGKKLKDQLKTLQD